jgi:hypothetical protein
MIDVGVLFIEPSYPSKTCIPRFYENESPLKDRFARGNDKKRNGADESAPYRKYKK